jgi:hypothetical protein
MQNYLSTKRIIEREERRNDRIHYTDFMYCKKLKSVIQNVICLFERSVVDLRFRETMAIGFQNGSFVLKSLHAVEVNVFWWQVF